MMITDDRELSFLFAGLVLGSKLASGPCELDRDGDASRLPPARDVGEWRFWWCLRSPLSRRVIDRVCLSGEPATFCASSIHQPTIAVHRQGISVERNLPAVHPSDLKSSKQPCPPPTPPDFPSAARLPST